MIRENKPCLFSFKIAATLAFFAASSAFGTEPTHRIDGEAELDDLSGNVIIFAAQQENTAIFTDYFTVGTMDVYGSGGGLPEISFLADAAAGFSASGNVRIGTADGDVCVKIQDGRYTVGGGGELYVGYASGATGRLELNGGALELDKPVVCNANTTASMVFDGGVLRLLSAFSASTSSLISEAVRCEIRERGIVIDTDRPAKLVLSNFTVAQGVTPKLTKKGAGTLTIDKIPASMHLDVTVEGGTVAFPATMPSLSSISFTGDGGATIPDPGMFADAMERLSISPGKTATFTLTDYFTATISSEDFVAGEFDWRSRVVPLSTATVWTGGESGDFSSSMKWRKGTSLASSQSSISNALVTNKVTFAVGADVTINNACFLDDVSFFAKPGASGSLDLGGTIRSAGKVTYCDGMEIRCSTSANIYAMVEVPQGASVGFAGYNNSATATFLGGMSGEGTFTLKDKSSTVKGIAYFNCDMGGFGGTIATAYNSSNSYMRFYEAATNMANATVVLGTKGNSDASLCRDAATYVFGSLDGKVKGGSAAVEIVTGALDAEDKNIAASGTGSWRLVKKGKRKLTVTGTDFAGYTLDNGTLATVSTAKRPVTTIAGCSVTGPVSKTWSLDTAGGTILESVGLLLPGEWISSHSLGEMSEAELTGPRVRAPGCNGCSYLACYALGLDPDDETSVPVASVSVDGDGRPVLGLGDHAVPENVRLDFAILSSSDPAGGFAAQGGGAPQETSCAIEPSDIDGVRYYKLQISISGKK